MEKICPERKAEKMIPDRGTAYAKAEGMGV